MIKYLQGLRRKKGFTMAELIVVVAIIGVLIAMILPMFNKSDADIQSANTYATDFFASLQYNFTRYQLTEYHVSPNMQKATEQTYMAYDASRAGNYLKKPQIFIEAYYDRGLQYVKVSDSFSDLLTNSDTTSNTELEKLLENDLKDTINQADTGYYYALVKYDVYDTKTTEVNGAAVTYNYGNIKVKSVHYCRQPASTLGSYVFSDYGMINGVVVGSCSNDFYIYEDETIFVGNPKSRFLNQIVNVDPDETTE